MTAIWYVQLMNGQGISLNLGVKSKKSPGYPGYAYSFKGEGREGR